MRGDSIRDFYAKTLALAGLGVLAGAGALVDYWPTGVELPGVSPALTRPQLAIALPVSDPDPSPMTDVVLLSVAPRRLSPRFAIADPVGVDTPMLAVAVHEALPIGTTVTLGAPPSLALADDATREAMGQEVALSLPATDVRPETTTAMLAPVSSSDESGEDGFISGAFKKTRTSIVKTGAKTGSSIMTAFRAVSGAVRRVLPDFNQTALSRM